MTHLYHSAWLLFHDEMRVLFWISLITLSITLGFGLYVGMRFRRRQRSVLMAGVHLAWAVFSWLWFWATWYFWQIDWGVWRPHVAFWHFTVFLSAGVGLALGTVLGLILHYTKPKRGVTGKLLTAHGVVAVCTLASWAAGVWPFR